MLITLTSYYLLVDISRHLKQSLWDISQKRLFAQDYLETIFCSLTMTV